MAYTEGNLLGLVNAPPGRKIYSYDTTDTLTTVETAGYFNNKDDNLNLQIGDFIFVRLWSATPFAAGSLISKVSAYVVTNVISNEAAVAAGNVNIAECLVATSGVLSSLA